jgi:hypothetical protein
MRTLRALSVGLTSLLAAIILSAGLFTGVTPVSAVSPASDKEVLWTQNCLGWERTTAPNTKCVYGDKSSKTVIALVGDSHASHLFPAIERLAKLRHWKLVVLVKVSCGFADMRIRNVALGREYRECATWNANVVKRLKVLKPALTIVAMSRAALHAVRSADSSNSAKGHAIAREISKVPGKVAVIIDSPVRGQRTAGYTSMGVIEKVATTITHDTLISLTKATCSRWPCPLKVGSITKYRDSHHFTATFSRTILGAPGGALDKALRALLP